MNPEMQSTLLNTYPPILIATILKALREQLKESYQLHSVGRAARYLVGKDICEWLGHTHEFTVPFALCFLLGIFLQSH